MQGFRVWDKNTGQMYYDEFVIGTDGELYRIVFYSEIEEENVSVFLKPVSMKSCIIMWKSNLKDLADLPIYENDIVESLDGKKYRIRCNEDYEFYAIDECSNVVEINQLNDIKSIDVFIQ